MKKYCVLIGACFLMSQVTMAQAGFLDKLKSFSFFGKSKKTETTQVATNKPAGAILTESTEAGPTQFFVNGKLDQKAFNKYLFATYKGNTKRAATVKAYYKLRLQYLKAKYNASMTEHQAYKNQEEMPKLRNSAFAQHKEAAQLRKKLYKRDKAGLFKKEVWLKYLKNKVNFNELGINQSNFHQVSAYIDTKLQKMVPLQIGVSKTMERADIWRHTRRLGEHKKLKDLLKHYESLEAMHVILQNRISYYLAWKSLINEHFIRDQFLTK